MYYVDDLKLRQEYTFGGEMETTTELVIVIGDVVLRAPVTDEESTYLVQNIREVVTAQTADADAYEKALGEAYMEGMEAGYRAAQLEASGGLPGPSHKTPPEQTPTFVSEELTDDVPDLEIPELIEHTETVPDLSVPAPTSAPKPELAIRNPGARNSLSQLYKSALSRNPGFSYRRKEEEISKLAAAKTSKPGPSADSMGNPIVNTKAPEPQPPEPEAAPAHNPFYGTGAFKQG